MSPPSNLLGSLSLRGFPKSGITSAYLGFFRSFRQRDLFLSLSPSTVIGTWSTFVPEIERYLRLPLKSGKDTTLRLTVTLGLDFTSRWIFHPTDKTATHTDIELTIIVIMAVSMIEI